MLIRWALVTWRACRGPVGTSPGWRICNQIRLAIFKDALPHATRFGVLWSATAPSYAPVLQAVESASQNLGVGLQMIQVAAAEEFEEALATMARERNDGVFVVASSLMTRSHPALLAELALKYRLPTIHGSRENVVAGGS